MSRTIDTAMAALVLECSQRQVQMLVQEGRLTNIGERRRILLDLEEVSRLAAETRDR